MARIQRRQFVGNRYLFWALCLLGITLPLAVLYGFESFVTVDHEIDDPEAFLDAFRAGKVGGK
jgi:hypothetical protein